MKRYLAIALGVLMACRTGLADEADFATNIMVRARSALQQFLTEAESTNTMAHVGGAKLETQGSRLVITTPNETIFVTNAEKYRRNGYHMEPHPDVRYLTWNTQVPAVQLSVYQQHPSFGHIEKAPVVFPGKAKLPEEKNPVVLALLRAFKRNGIELKEADEEAPNNTPEDIRR